MIIYLLMYFFTLVTSLGCLAACHMSHGDSQSPVAQPGRGALLFLKQAPGEEVSRNNRPNKERKETQLSSAQFYLALPGMAWFA